MNKQREAKAAVVAEIKEKLSNSIVTILADYRGMNVAEMTRLRRQLREAGVEFKVVKNTLTRRAAQELGLDGLEPFLEGPTAAAFSLNDPAAPAKILSEVMRNSKTFQIKAGVLQGRVIGLDEIKALADLPSREQLLAKVVGGFQAPLAGLVNVLAGNTRNLVYVLEAIRKKKEEAA
ncbi:MAG: large subunit ribosomal protein [Moorella sp. (in: firmicutes)]|jgi:large subunit ribosomal protein L10|uniref:50S ribosomal protein L10 n=1 Tax=unclassified Neomoorella TaxID=2676739 RepID=UPI0010FFB30C|nr:MULTISPECIES: 50S ribosomal protein L10 [unclassified Moorella (in: firmicutes)]MDK2817796.1 large subunit ribosomal protein [Moorella sp. (in: firmicutes)]MDK2895609.1 large subunit ribosomal protein [Moorella sp. (in: firmicutes)]GEA14407.1 50S ribosomal protein L10 [Moorella sp. E308F]GEA18221.1 50S ribosomal protein L10 [Moorella sp. E306M]